MKTRRRKTLSAKLLLPVDKSWCKFET